MKKRLLLLLLLAWQTGYGQSDTIQLRPNALKASLVLSARYRIDTTDQLTVTRLAKMPFKQPAQKAFLLGFSTHPIWLRLTLRQETATPTDYLLQLTNWFADNVDFYVPQPGGGYRVVHAGDRVALRDREPKTRYPSVPVRLTDSLPHTVYVRVLSTQYHSYTLSLWRQDLFIRSRLAGDSTEFTLGLVLMRITFQLALLVFMFRYNAFRGYSVHGFSVCLVYLLAGGNSSVFFPNSPYWANVSYFIATALVPVSLAYYVYEVFDVRRNFPRLMPVLNTIGAISIAYLLYNFGWQQAYVTWAFAAFLALAFTFFSVIIVVLYIKGPRPTIWYVLPLPIHLLPYAYVYARNAGFLPGSLQEDQLRFSLTLQFILVPFFIAGMIRDVYRERAKIRQDLIVQKIESDQLLELDKLKTQFFTNISHEFRTPLTLMLGPVEQMAQEYAQDSRFPLIQRNANRLLSLINQLLDLSKLSAGQLRPIPETGDMVTFFRTLTSSFSSLAESRRIRFTLTQNETGQWASFDRDKVEKIVTNLLLNAFKFTPLGNEVRMDVRYLPLSKPGEVIVIIADTGIGIAADNLTHIFERFYQGSVHTRPSQARSADARSDASVEGHSNRPYEGTGIGLALVSELIRVLDGRIEVASTEGVGTTFTVTLPLVPVDTPHPADTPVPDPELIPSFKSPRIETLAGANQPVGVSGPEVSPPPTTENILLIIDDNADIRAYVRSIFAADYQIIEAEDGQDGLEKATASLPDIVICDLMMPRLDGFGFCRLLKSQEATSHIPVVMLTAKATVEDRIEGFELGADDYLTKPFNRAEIQARVGNLVQQRQRLYQHFITNRTVNGESSTPAIEPVKSVEPRVLAAEQKFLDRLSWVVLQHIDQEDFTVEDLAGAVAMSRVQLHRKLKTLTNNTATQFIREIRLGKAAQLLNEGGMGVTQVAYAVGFDNLSYFAKLFQERYGVLPSQYGKASAPLRE